MDDNRRCTADTRAGPRCQKAAIRGGTVCRSHGGHLPQVKAAAQKRVVLAEARRMVARDESNAEPIEHLVDSLKLASAQVDVWGAIVADLDDPDKPGELLTFSKAYGASLHPFITERDAWSDRKAKYAEMCLKAGVSERVVQITEGQHRKIFDDFEAALAETKLSEAQKQEFRVAYAGQLRGDASSR